METLKGKNEIRMFRQVAEKIKGRLIKHEGVAGIIFIGGLTRRFADKYSDVDIIVLMSRKSKILRRKIKKIADQEHSLSGLDIDLEAHSLEDFERTRWDEMDKWDFSHAEIVYDVNGEIRDLIKRKVKVSKGFWLKRIVVCGEYLKWYCCPPQKDVGTITEAWIDRGDLISAHYCLNYSVDLMTQMIFALNKEFLPAPKWSVFYSQHLKWLPKNFKRLVEEALTVRDLTTAELNRRLRVLRRMWLDVLPKIKEETGLTPELISKRYVAMVLHQD